MSATAVSVCANCGAENLGTAFCETCGAPASVAAKTTAKPASTKAAGTKSTSTKTPAKAAAATAPATKAPKAVSKGAGEKKAAADSAGSKQTTAKPATAKTATAKTATAKTATAKSTSKGSAQPTVESVVIPPPPPPADPVADAAPAGGDAGQVAEIDEVTVTRVIPPPPAPAAEVPPPPPPPPPAPPASEIAADTIIAADTMSPAQLDAQTETAPIAEPETAPIVEPEIDQELAATVIAPPPPPQAAPPPPPPPPLPTTVTAPAYAPAAAPAAGPIGAPGSNAALRFAVTAYAGLTASSLLTYVAVLFPFNPVVSAMAFWAGIVLAVVVWIAFTIAAVVSRASAGAKVAAVLLTAVAMVLLYLPAMLPLNFWASAISLASPPLVFLAGALVARFRGWGYFGLLLIIPALAIPALIPLAAVSSGQFAVVSVLLIIWLALTPVIVFGIAAAANAFERAQARRGFPVSTGVPA